MKTLAITTVFAVIFITGYSFSSEPGAKKEAVYNVVRLKQPMKIDGKWDKPQWQNIEPLEINNFMGDLPKFHPVAQAKVMYDDDNLYVIFRVQDRYIHCIAKKYNDVVCEDACVEFFFSPDTSLPGKYFNIEINCGGTPLIAYNIVPRKEFKQFENDDFKKIEIAHSLPKIIEKEITEPTTWTIEYRVPLAMLEKYSKVTHPKHGIAWKANFYKVAQKGSNVHFLTWSVVENKKPDFHLPQFFGTLNFQ